MKHATGLHLVPHLLAPPCRDVTHTSTSILCIAMSLIDKLWPMVLRALASWAKIGYRFSTDSIVFRNSTKSTNLPVKLVWMSSTWSSLDSHVANWNELPLNGSWSWRTTSVTQTTILRRSFWPTRLDFVDANPDSRRNSIKIKAEIPETPLKSPRQASPTESELHDKKTFHVLGNVINDIASSTNHENLRHVLDTFLPR